MPTTIIPSHMSTTVSVHRKKIKTSVIRQLLTLQRCRCLGCRAVLVDGFDVDHRIALFLGGPDCLTNLCLLCRTCHGIKSSHERTRSGGDLAALFARRQAVVAYAEMGELNSALGDKAIPLPTEA